MLRLFSKTLLTAARICAAGVSFGCTALIPVTMTAASSLHLPPPGLPVGTSVSVRTVEMIDSKGAEAGGSYRCTIDSPVVVEGQQLVARGADCVLRIAEMKEAGRLSGHAELQLELTALRLGKDLVAVSSDAATLQGAGKSKGTVIKTGVGAAAGAALGGIFGGGKGAAIGAGAGAAAGVATGAMTHGPQIRVAPETVLTFVTR